MIQTIRVPNEVIHTLSPVALGAYATAGRILLATSGKAGRLRGKLNAGCVGQFSPAWKELRPYLKIVRIPVGHNRSDYYYELLHKPDDSIPYIRSLTMAEGRRYLADRNRVRGYREPEINGKEKYTHVPVAVLADRATTLALRGLMISAWYVAALEKNGQLKMHKREICKATHCKEGRINASWNLGKELGYICQRRVINEQTGLIDWVYELLEEPDAEYCAAARPEIRRRADVCRKGNTVSDPAKTAPHAARGAEERAAVEDLVRDNLHYDTLIADAGRAPLYYRPADIDGYVKLIVDTVCTNKETVRIGSEDLPADIVRQQMLCLTGDHLLYVMECIDRQQDVTNPRAYKLTALYRAADTADIAYKVG